MTAQRFGDVVKRRMLGVLLIAVVGSLITLSIAVYNQVFTKVVLVKLETDHTGNQLLPHSDVKERGVIVGEVRSISSHGDGATITMALKPSQAKTIKNYYVAQLLPKTLFGERYVALSPPAGDAAQAASCKPTQAPGPVKGGQTMCQDNSVQYAEVENVLADLMPVLQSLKPAELNATLNALATALSGRGEQLGRDLVKADTYLKALNPHVPQLVDDLDKLGKVALEYNSVAPDLFDTLNNLQTTSKTLVAKQSALDSLLSVTTSTSDVLTRFLDTNTTRLITVTSTSNNILGLLDEYAPEYGCLLKAIAGLEPRLDSAFRDGRLHVTIELVKSRGKYVPGNEPRAYSGLGPQCAGLPNPPVPYQTPPLYQHVNDGAPLVGGQGTGAMASPIRDAYGPGSAAETAMINALIAKQYGTTPDKVPTIDTVLAAPLIRGSQVTLR